MIRKFSEGNNYCPETKLLKSFYNIKNSNNNINNLNHSSDLLKNTSNESFLQDKVKKENKSLASVNKCNSKKTYKEASQSCERVKAENQQVFSTRKYQPYDSRKVNRELLLKLNIIVNPNTMQYFQRRNYKICYDFRLSNKKDITNLPEQKIDIENKQIRKIKFVTLKDYDALNPYELLKYDKRSIFRLFWDIAITEHPLLNLIFFKSLMEPLWIRFILFIFEFKVGLALSALFFSDDYIDTRSEVPKEMRVKLFKY